jgi:hypothetical protein
MYQRQPKDSNKNSVAVAAAVAVTDVVIAGADVAAKIATQNGKSVSFKSDGCPKPSKVAKR